MAFHEQSTIDAIIALAGTGLTRSAIAAQIGGLSRSAVCGVLWRAGVVAPKVTKAKRALRNAQKPAPKAKRLSRDNQSQPPQEETRENENRLLRSDQSNRLLRSNQPVAWDDLESHHCRWPVGDDMWCAGVRATGRSYCERHHKLAYRKAA